MIAYPIVFKSQAIAQFGKGNSWSIYSGENSALCSIPPEFEGPGGGFSPEDLFAQSLINCFVATFQVMSAQSRVSFDRVEVEGTLTVDKDESRQPRMKKFLLQIRLYSPSHPDRLKVLVKKAIESGFVLNSVKTTIEFKLDLR